MSKNKTEKSKYVSKYGAGHITYAQKIVEIICENVAEKQRIKLLDFFWHNNKWKNFYIEQIKLANKLLKKYQEYVIIDVLVKNKHICHILDKNFHNQLKIYSYQENRIENNIVKLPTAPQKPKGKFLDY